MQECNTQHYDIMKTTTLKSLEKLHTESKVNGDFSPYDANLRVANMKKCKTACWSHNGKVHLIKVHRDIEYTLPDKGGIVKNLPLMVKRVYTHEKCHGFFTTLKLKGISKMLAAEDCPFHVFNLFEDCRIEFFGSILKKIIWHWERWLEMPSVEHSDGSFDPLGCLMALKMIERRSKMRQEFYDKIPSTHKRDFRIVWGYYKLITSLIRKVGGEGREFSEYTAEVAIKFVKKYPELKHSSPTGLFENFGDEDFDDKDKWGDQDDDEDGSIDKERWADEIREDGSQERVDQRGSTSRIRKTYAANDWKEGCGNVVAEIMSTAMKGGLHHMLPSTDASEEIDTDDFINKRGDFYREEYHSSSVKGRKVVMIVDCSSSMGGGHFEEGIILADALMTLHKKGECQLVIWWTGHNQQIRQTGGVPNKWLERMSPGAGWESYGECMDLAEGDMLDACNDDGAVICYTDGGITDKDKPRTQHFRSVGVEPVGAYVGPVYNMSNALKYFTRAACRENINDLALELARLITD